MVRDAATGEVLAERAESLGVATNNVAEYRGLIAGLTAAAELGAAEVEVRMDSKLVVEQMSGRWQIKHAGLRPLRPRRRRWCAGFDSVTFAWIPRERNKHADALANAAMDGPPANRRRPRRAEAPARSPPSTRRPAPRPGRPPRAPRRGPPPPRSRPPAPDPGRRAPPRPPPGWSWSGTARPTVHRAAALLRPRRRAALTDRGVAQAKAAARRVAQLAPDAAAVVSSPLSRCTGTAATIAAALGAPAGAHDEDLIECDFGVWEGLTFAEVQATVAAGDDRRGSPRRRSPRPGRVVRAGRASGYGARCGGCVEAYPAETVVVVTHVSPIKLLLRDALAAGDGFLHRLFLDPAGVSVVDFWPDGGVAVRTVNDTAHLAGL